MIQVKNLTKIYNDKIAVDNISMDINDGEILAFIGNNGAGKTTTIKSIVGINNFDKGEIYINDISLKDNPIGCKKLMAYVPDNPDLYDNMKAIYFINFICDMYEVSSDTRKDNIIKYAKMFEIESHLNEEISTFSHGMRQKVSLIAALSHNPKILIMDEPFVGLDPIAVSSLKKEMKQMAKDGKIIFFSTHILEVAEKLCDKVAIINDGKIIKCGSMKDITGDKSLEAVFLKLGKNNNE